MKGRWVFIFGLVLVLSMSFASAGLFDFLKKKESITITGNVIHDSLCVSNFCEGEQGDLFVFSVENVDYEFEIMVIYSDYVYLIDTINGEDLEFEGVGDFMEYVVGDQTIKLEILEAEDILIMEYRLVAEEIVGDVCGDGVCQESEDSSNCLGDCPVMVPESYCDETLEAGEWVGANCVLYEGQMVDVGAREIYLYYISDMDAILDIDGNTSGKLAEGDSYEFYNLFSLEVDEILYDSRVEGISYVEFSLELIEEGKCFDSDGGDDIYVKGSASGDFSAFGDQEGSINEDKVYDYCMQMVWQDGNLVFPWQVHDQWNITPKTIYDYAVGKCEENCGVYEMSCGEGYDEGIEKMMVLGSAFSCPSGCFEGACVSESESHCRGNVCILYEGEEVHFEDHAVFINYLDSDSVKLTIQGGYQEKTDGLYTGDYYVAEDGLKIKIAEIEFDEDRSYIEFVWEFEEEQKSYCDQDDQYCELHEGESVLVEGFGFDRYEVEIALVDEPYTKLWINGVPTGLLEERGGKQIFEELIIEIEDIDDDDGKGEGRVDFNYELEEEEEPLICDEGCIFNERCLNPGVRKDGMYCDVFTGEMINQSLEGVFCDNNFECDSNLCVSGECVSGGLFKKIIEFFRNLFGGGSEIIPVNDSSNVTN